jgi:hypothetical protein
MSQIDSEFVVLGQAEVGRLAVNYSALGDEVTAGRLVRLAVNYSANSLLGFWVRRQRTVLSGHCSTHPGSRRFATR